MTLAEEQKLASFKADLRKLEDAYLEVIQVFHNSQHYAVRQSLSVALRELNEAIHSLREALK
jgi:hypothetical protein